MAKKRKKAKRERGTRHPRYLKGAALKAHRKRIQREKADAKRRVHKRKGGARRTGVRRSGKRRTAAQRAATKRLVALNRARRGGGATTRRRRRKGSRSRAATVRVRKDTKGIAARVERLERFAVAQMRVNNIVAHNLNHIYRVTEIPRPASLRQLPALARGH